MSDYRPFRLGCGATSAGDWWACEAGGGPGLSRGTLANERRPCAALRQRARSTARRPLAAGRGARGLEAVVGDQRRLGLAANAAGACGGGTLGGLVVLGAWGHCPQISGGLGAQPPARLNSRGLLSFQTVRLTLENVNPLPCPLDHGLLCLSLHPRFKSSVLLRYDGHFTSNLIEWLNPPV